MALDYDVPEDDGPRVVSLAGGRTASNKRPRVKVGATQVTLYPIVPPDEGGRVLSARYPEDLLAALDKLFHMEGFPYETTAQALRDALLLLIEAYDARLGISDQQLQTVVDTRRRHAHSRFQKEERAKAEGLAHHIQEQLYEALDADDLDETFKVLTTEWGASAGIALEFWRNWYVRAFGASRMVRLAASVLRSNGYTLPPDLVRTLWRKSKTSPT